MVKSTLGRGLGSLIPQKQTAAPANGAVPAQGAGRPSQIETDKIVPNPQQPREDFDRHGLEDLINSIKIHGIIQPVIVMRDGENYQLIAGERRLRAAKIIGLKKVPAVIRSANEQEKLELALVENVQRQSLNPIEKAFGYLRLVDEFDLKQEEVGQRVGQSRATVANTLRLLTLPPEIQRALRQGDISEGHAKVLLGVKDDNERKKIFNGILADGLSVRTTESQARKVSVRGHKRIVKKDPNLADQEDTLQQALGTKVEISRKGRRGLIRIHFYSKEELRAIINKIAK